MNLNQQEIVFDMLDYYFGHPERFSFVKKPDDSMICAYLSKDNQVCGVGRCFNKETMNALIKLRQEEPEIFDDMNTNDVGSFISFMEETHEIKNVFEEKYSYQPTHFWASIQTLHDDFATSHPTYWTKEARLTPRGKLFLEEEFLIPEEGVLSAIEQLEKNMFAVAE